VYIAAAREIEMNTSRIPHIAMSIAASCLLAGCANERLDSLEQRVAKLEQAQSAPFEAQRRQDAVDLEGPRPG
jgi:outer membrane murein-binding lipoprotein Lpp